MEIKKEEAKDHEKIMSSEHIDQVHERNNSKEVKKKCCNKKDFNLGFSFGLLATSIVVALLVLPSINKEKRLDSERITNKVESFINNNLLNGGNPVTVKEKATEEHGLYKVVIDVGDGKDLNSYITKDEKILLFQGIDIEKTEKEKAEGANETPTSETKDLPKNEKPKVELFVMSHCPFGTQIEKGILPVVKTLGDKIDFEIKFVDYAMHAEEEINEQLQQHCIKSQEKEKFVPYLECFLEKGDSVGCLARAKIDASKLDSCIIATDKEYKIMENFKDKSTYKGQYPTFNIYREDNLKYGVGGSPTLIINGVTANSSRDSKSLLSVICSTFENAPEECNTELSSDQPAPGFGSATTTGGSEASCG
ncbi:hypothetical protein KAJ41_02335 [Candidatus Parcubacteria bacterium]|nr:hypothetical protein [Candidatus Parcubacteria bacterium]